MSKNLTQVQLAARVSVSAAAVSQIEGGKRKPGETLLSAFGEVLGFHPRFFLENSPIQQLSVSDVNFRHRASTSEALKLQVSAKATLFTSVARYLDERLGFPEFNVPVKDVTDSGTNDGIEEIAIHCRNHWGLGIDNPITNMVRVAEHAGVITTDMEEAKEVDAFSGIDCSFGIIVLNSSVKSSSRTRFDIGHELGHLVMHRRLMTGSRALEREANRFAAAFLMPKDGFLRDFQIERCFDWTHLFELKKRWKTSVASIVFRARELKMIGAVEFRRLFQKMSAKGWRSQPEPYEPPPEPPELFKNAVQKLAESRGLGLADVAAQLGFSVEKMHEVSGLPVQSPLSKKVTRIDDFRRLAK